MADDVTPTLPANSRNLFERTTSSASGACVIKNDGPNFVQSAEWNSSHPRSRSRLLIPHASNCSKARSTASVLSTTSLSGHNTSPVARESSSDNRERRFGRCVIPFSPGASGLMWTIRSLYKYLSMNPRAIANASGSRSDRKSDSIARTAVASINVSFAVAGSVGDTM